MMATWHPLSAPESGHNVLAWPTLDVKIAVRLAWFAIMTASGTHNAFLRHGLKNSKQPQPQLQVHLQQMRRLQNPL
jgi:hypothetical protein